VFRVRGVVMGFSVVAVRCAGAHRGDWPGPDAEHRPQRPAV